MKNTPWGMATRSTEIGGGITLVQTGSHGGYYVPPALNAIIPLAWRQGTFKGLGTIGWYEEDCDWCVVALAFPTLFPPEAAAEARRMFDSTIGREG